VRRLMSGKRAKAGDRVSGAENDRPLTCEGWMTREVLTVKPRDSVAHARVLLEERRINQLPVVKNGKLVGIVTDRDLRDAVNTVAASVTVAGMAQPAPATPKQIPIEAMMTGNVKTLSPHSNLIVAAELMRRERIGSVPIVDADSLVGIVTRSDILAAFVARERPHGAKQPPGLARSQATHKETGS
jgi:acetoin utilization protein AcuB